jgi:hypothetical protein
MRTKDDIWHTYSSTEFYNLCYYSYLRKLKNISARGGGRLKDFRSNFDGMVTWDLLSYCVDMVESFWYLIILGECHAYKIWYVAFWPEVPFDRKWSLNIAQNANLLMQCLLLHVIARCWWMYCDVQAACRENWRLENTILLHIHICLLSALSIFLLFDMSGSCDTVNNTHVQRQNTIQLGLQHIKIYWDNCYNRFMCSCSNSGWLFI